MKTDDHIFIETRNFSFSYPPTGKGTERRPALADINLAIEIGSITVLVGPSGCGKTTLCRCLTGAIPKLIKGTLTGEVYIGGREIAHDDAVTVGALSAQIGFVTQEPDHQIVMTAVEDDIAFGPENLMKPPAAIRSSVDAQISNMGLAGKAETNPSALSGGEKQRLALGGILAMNPEAMIFDEPMSNLDADGRTRFTRRIKELKSGGRTVVIVEHDFELFDFADRWVLMKDGRLICADAPANIPRSLLEDELWR
ncbi:MAG: energy-coupling factor ABC transporter ATP-binding protein [Clostridiales Family XIII bacterium]|jgi:energy-coupling factor transporter ATP-binding protein EcfA2|nr:energy-coupling factor ABC transporter ATP-binding protein [Clostridiales Family XIII bacterium]